MNKPAQICLATNYLIMTEASRQMWTELARQLEESGFKLVLLSSAPVETPLPFPVISIPFLLRDYAQQFPGACRQTAVSSEADWEILLADCGRAQGGYPPAEAIPGLFACRQFIRTLLNTLQPSYVLTWDSTSPLAIVIRDLCHEAHLPVQAIERGLLPETLMIESRGMQGYSDMRTHWLAQEIPEAAFDPAAYERVRNFYLNRKPQKYQQPTFQGTARARQELQLGTKRAIVFFGHYDPCGLAPADSLQRRFHSPAFRSTEDLLMSLCPLLKDLPDHVLIFKPHPIDGNPYTAAQAQGVRVVKDFNVHALIDLADVVVAQFTTLQFEAALYDKPIVLAGRSAWWGRNAAYEADTREDLGPALFAALDGHDWPTRSTNSRAFLTWLMNDWLIGCTSEVPTRRKLSHLAKFLARTALVSDDTTSVEQRVVMVENKLREWRASAPARPSEPSLESQRRAVELFSQGQAPTPATKPAICPSVTALRDRAELLRQVGQWREAGEIYRGLCNQLPDDLTVWQGRLECLTHEGHGVMVRLLRADALRAHPEWADVLVDPTTKPAKSKPTETAA